MRLIDADELLKYISPEDICARIAISAVPTADVRENVRGEWIRDNSKATTVYAPCKCSVCGNWNDKVTNFCPNCGAEMLRCGG